MLHPSTLPSNDLYEEAFSSLMTVLFPIACGREATTKIGEEPATAKEDSGEQIIVAEAPKSKTPAKYNGNGDGEECTIELGSCTRDEEVLGGAGYGDWLEGSSGSVSIEGFFAIEGGS
ncbi:hypothetical protein SLA2020_009780 [Shorea laevis]